MLKPEEIEVRAERAVGGDFVEIVHKPTGISREAGPPLPRPAETQRKLLAEIEAELVNRELTEYLEGEKRSGGS